MEYEPTIGIETHAQLLTASKAFCPCRTDYATAPPNTLVCPVCLGMPGSLPVVNRRAVEYVIMTGLALNCHIAELARFDRKNYNYPDLVKGYQISQYDLPLALEGWLDIRVGDALRRIGIQDVHLEEDTGKLVHVKGESWIDFNRSGVPLMEIVTKPDFVSVEEVREYVLLLRRILRYLGVSTGNMEEGAMRFEANVSLHPVGTTTKGTRVEVKNLNSFRALLRSLDHEILRQAQVLREGGQIHRETRGWDDERGVTVIQRSKEMADDYRYFPEPDIPPLEITPEWIAKTQAALPELPQHRHARFVSEHGLSAYDAGLLTEERAVADFFEATVAQGRSRGVTPKTVANWVTGEIFRLLRDRNAEIAEIPLTPGHLAELLGLVQEGRVTMIAAKRVLEVMFTTGRVAPEIIAAEKLAPIADADALSSIVEEVIAANPAAVAQYRGGKESVLRFLVGQVMKATRGKADPVIAAQLLRHKLGA